MRLGDRVVDVDGAGTSSSPSLVHLVEAVHAGGGLLGHALDLRAMRVEYQLGSLGELRLDRGEEDASPPRWSGLASTRGVLLGARAQVQQQRRVAAVVEDHVRSGRRPATRRSGGCSPSTRPAISPLKANTGVPPAAMAAAAWSWVEKMLHEAQRTSAPSAFSVSISTAVWMVMCSEPVMRAPLSGCVCGVLLADGHQAGHLGLGDGDFLAAPVGERDVGDLVVGKSLFWCVHFGALRQLSRGPKSEAPASFPMRAPLSLAEPDPPVRGMQRSSAGADYRPINGSTYNSLTSVAASD